MTQKVKVTNKEMLHLIAVALNKSSSFPGAKVGVNSTKQELEIYLDSGTKFTIPVYGDKLYYHFYLPDNNIGTIKKTKLLKISTSEAN